MKRAPLFLVSLLSVAALIGGCSKSDAPDLAEQADAPAAAQEAPAAEPQVAVAPADAPAVPETQATETASAPAADSAAPAESSAPVAELPPVAAGPVMDRFAQEEKAFQDWCRRFGLDPNDPAMLDADNDSDGIPNREEFVGNSDPLDAKSRPGVLANMRLQAYNEVRLPVMLDQVKGDKAFLKQIEGGEEKEEVVKTGDTVRGMKVGRVVTRRETDKTGQPVDVSRVTLEDESTKERVTLVKGMPARTAATHAVIVSPDGGTSITVRQGETFEWPGQGGTPGAHYTVVDMSEDQVVVQEVENQKMWTIPRR